MPDEQDRAEAVDDDKLGGDYPPERPLGAHRRQDDAVSESFAGREARTEPEVDEGPLSPEDEVEETPEAEEEAALDLREASER
jgi:hypothetical protein